MSQQKFFVKNISLLITFTLSTLLIGAEIPAEQIQGTFLGTKTTTDIMAQPEQKDLQTRNPQVVALSFLASSLTDAPGVFPPDTMGAVGPTQFMVVIHERVRTFSKATGRVDGVMGLCKTMSS